jgi:hypothetical protein
MPGQPDLRSGVPRLLARVGHAAFGGGPHWRSGVENMLGISQRAFLRWLQGDEVPRAAWPRLLELLEHRQKFAAEVIAELKQKIAEEEAKNGPIPPWGQ